LAYGGLADLPGPVIESVLPALPSLWRRAVEVVLGRAEPGQDAVEPVGARNSVVGAELQVRLRSHPPAMIGV
jgi:hypothetical protein